MIHVWYSNQIEQLVQRLIDNLRARPTTLPASIFESINLVVPNRNLEAYLKFEIARNTGIAANLAFHALNRFLMSLIAPGPPRCSLLELSVIQNLLLCVLADPAGLQDPKLAPVQAYLQSPRTDDALDLRRFQLAEQLARLFENYAYSRPEMLDGWQRGQLTLQDTPFAATETWQQALWHRLSGADGILRKQDVRLLTPAELAEVLAEVEITGPSVVHVFGFSYVGRAYQRIFAALARKMDVHLYTPVPSLVFREDWQDADKRGMSRSDLPPREQRVGVASLLENADPFGLERVGETPALRLWGRPGREYLHLLDQLPDVQLHPDFVVPSQTPRSLLGRLQRDIVMRTPAALPGTPAACRADASMVILACPGIQREVEVIANEIWSLVVDDDRRQRGAQRARLRFNDIAVIVANSREREAYQSQIRYVFAELYDLPFNLLDVSALRASRVVQAVERLLALPLGGFTRPELLGLLTHPALRARFPDANTDEWQSWCQETSIVHGADHHDHEDLYIEKDLLNWDQGLRRIVLGTFMTGARSGDERPFPIEDRSYLSQEYPVGSLDNAALLVLLVRSLVADARFAGTARLSLTDWALFLGQMAAAYLGGEDEDEERNLAQCLAEIARLRELDVDGRLVSYRTAYEFARSALAALQSKRGHYLAEGVAVSSFLPMRTLPFRVVFLCGLAEGQFPAREGNKALDLLHARRLAGDVSVRERDRYLFLETLLSTRERLYLSYVARDGQTGEDVEPSSVVRELQHILRLGYLDDTAVKSLERRHSLRRHDVTYFPRSADAEPCWRNYSPAARREAGACALRERLHEHLGQPHRPLKADDLRQLRGGLGDWLGLCPLPRPEPRTEPNALIPVSLAAIRRFLECPLQGWARLQLGMREEEDEDLSERADENFTMPRRDMVVFLREVFLNALAGTPRGEKPPFAEVYDARATYLELRGTMPTGLFHGAERVRHVSLLNAWYENFERLELAEHGPFRVLRFGRAEEYLQAADLQQPIFLNLTLPGDAGTGRSVRVELYGRTEALAATRAASLTLVAHDKPEQRDYLRGFLDYLFVTISDPGSGRAYEAFIAAKKQEGKRPFAPLTPQQARGYLDQLLIDMLAGPHDYLLPCEAVFTARAPGNSQSITTIVNAYREDAMLRCSSRFGPVPYPERYEPPPEEEARAMIERRFGTFFREP